MVDEKSATEVQQKIQPTRAQQTPPPLKVVKKVVKKPVAPMVTQAQPQLEAPAGPKGKVAKVRRAVDTRLEQKVTLLPHYTGFKIVQRKKDSTTLVQVQTADGKILLTQTTMPDVYTDPLTKTNYKIGESDSLTQVLKLCNRYNASQVRNKQTESLLKEIEDLEERVSALGEQNKSLELEIKTYSSFGTPEELASKLNEFEQYKREVTEKIAGLEQQLERKKSFDELLGTSTVAKDKEIEELTNKITELQQEYDKSLSKFEQELAKSGEDYKTLLQENVELKEKIQDKVVSYEAAETPPKVKKKKVKDEFEMLLQNLKVAPDQETTYSVFCAGLQYLYNKQEEKGFGSRVAKFNKVVAEHEIPNSEGELIEILREQCGDWRKTETLTKFYLTLMPQ